MKAEAELSDKEWRQMRRQMSKLDFEPVPETPALLPRSLYGESDQELASIYEEKPEESVGVGAVPTCHCHYSPKNRSRAFLASTTSTSDSSLTELGAQSEATTKNQSAELPSTSMTISPMITKRYQPQEQKRPPESTFELNDAELAALDAQMAAAQDATRRLVMGAFLNLKTKKAKTEALERMKLSAAHASDIKILQNTVGELKEKVTRAEEQRDQRILLLDRFSEFSAKQSHLNSACKSISVLNYSSILSSIANEEIELSAKRQIPSGNAAYAQYSCCLSSKSDSANFGLSFAKFDYQDPKVVKG
ncbi:hypothetical protein JG687_00002299 [Phytophthora cactorum]|uniref:Uncharacterized protein n=1 Tax=Phytophthora cactorum TaxID=29920 RepID=A0A8T1UVS1_9STRA|nr:hypothetical protein JG687_00002299 [Phytophthora cactorum]